MPAYILFWTIKNGIRRRLWALKMQYVVRWPKVGDVVEDCRYEKHSVIEIDYYRDSVTLDDGANCSISHCLTRI